MSKTRRVVGLLGIFAIAVSLWHLLTANDGLTVTETSIGTTPVTVFATDSTAPAPVVVIAHGFSGSQQLMHPFAVSLARAGYIAVTFDFLGHGENPEPMRGDLTAVDGTTEYLRGELARVIEFTRDLPTSNGEIAVLGHSMATDIIVRQAQADPAIDATIAVSMFAPTVTETSPANLLVIVGGLEAGLKAEAERVIALAASPEPATENVTYGAFSDGTARRMIFADGAEHIGVLYNRESLAGARDWLNATFDRDLTPPTDVRGRWIGLLLLGVLLAAYTITQLLPVVATAPQGAAPRWRKLLPVAIAPVVLTPLILWPIPSSFLPILVGDYLALHFALYGVLTFAGLWLSGWRPAAIKTSSTSRIKLLFAIAALGLFNILAFLQPIEVFALNVNPIPSRLPLVAVMLAALLPFFLADEWLVRGPNPPRGGYLVTKLLFAVSLAIAVALDFEGLFFLIIIVPVILVFFIVFGLISGWVYRRTNHPFVGAGGTAIVLAWLIASTFPLVATGG